MLPNDTQNDEIGGKKAEMQVDGMNVFPSLHSGFVLRDMIIYGKRSKSSSQSNGLHLQSLHHDSIH